MPVPGRSIILLVFYNCHILAAPVFTFAGKKRKLFMGKTLHIVPGEFGWPYMIRKWIGKGREKVDYEIMHYPAKLGFHYLPQSLSDAEMMRTALSLEKDAHRPLSEYYDSLMHFANTVRDGKSFDKVIVWHDESAASRLLLCLISNSYEHRLYAVDISPASKKKSLISDIDNSQEDKEVSLVTIDDINWDRVTPSSFKPKVVTLQQRKKYRELWLHWGGEDYQDCPVLVNQCGNLFHVHRTYLYSDIFAATSKAHPMTAGEICSEVAHTHPQVGFDYVYETLVKMMSEGLIKRVRCVNADPFQDMFQQYKYDVEGEWNRDHRDFLYHFVEVCGKKLRISEDDLKAEYFRDHKDYENMWGQGHLFREEISKRREEWQDRSLIKWASAFNENWGWYHLMAVVKTKLEMIVEYMRHWSPVADAPVYADQMERAISLIEIIIDWGGQSKYAHSEDENDFLNAKHFAPYVNMRNRNRFPSPDYDGHTFWCEAQRVRFDKAWNILWDIFRTKMLTWDD